VRLLQVFRDVKGECKGKGKGKGVSVLNCAPGHEGVLGSVGIAPRIFNLGSKWW